MMARFAAGIAPPWAQPDKQKAQWTFCPAQRAWRKPSPGRDKTHSEDYGANEGQARPSEKPPAPGQADGVLNPLRLRLLACIYPISHFRTIAMQPSAAFMNNAGYNCKEM